jgi:tetratricopeptide (TPR) repeat protein
VWILLLQAAGVFSGLGAQEADPDRQDESSFIREERFVKQTLRVDEQRKFDYFFYEGVRLKNAEKYDASFEMFKHALEIDSTSSAALFEQASYYMQMNRSENAVSLMKKAVLYEPGNLEYRSTLSTLLFELGMFGEAAEAYEILVKAYPDRPELNYYLAESYSRMGEVGKAIDIYDALENVVGMREALSMEKYRLYMTIEQPENAFDELKKLAGKFPIEPRYPMMIGDLYLQQNDQEEALKYYNKAKEIDPNTPFYPVSMANYYEQTGQNDSARQQIHDALMNKELEVDIKMNILARYIVQQYSGHQDVGSADTLFQTLLEQHPDDSRLKLTYGEFLAMRQKFEEARFQYRLVTESEPENVAAWQQLLRLSLQTDDMEEVIRICIKCRSIFPDAMEFYFYQGIAYYRKQEYQQAIDLYTEAIPLIPAGNKGLISDFYGQIGDAYFKLRDTVKSFQAYEEALKYNDKNVMVLNNYAYYLSLLKRDLPKAERMSALCIKMDPNNATYIDTYAWVFFVQGNYSFAKLYIEQAISKDQTDSPELVDHYGDVLYMSGDPEKAVAQWKKAKEMGKKSATLDKKIAEQTYVEQSEDEIFNESELPELPELPDGAGTPDSSDGKVREGANEAE